MSRFAFAAIATCLGLYAWTVWYDRSLREEDPFGYRNLKACGTISPGVIEADLVQALGAPERSDQSGTVRRLFFHTHGAAASPISAEVDPATGRVLSLRCAGDDKPAWAVPR